MIKLSLAVCIYRLGSPKTNSEISLTTIAANAKIKKVFGTIYFFVCTLNESYSKVV